MLPLLQTLGAANDPAAPPGAIGCRPQPIPAAALAALEKQEDAPCVRVDKDWFTWCPSVIRGDDRRYHMFHSRWPKRLGFDAWLPYSEIVHAVADRPEGPYAVAGVAIAADGDDRGGWFTAHNPKITRFEGKYYLYFCQTKGNADAAKREEISRTGGKHPQWRELRENQRTFVASSDTLTGPWRISPKPIVEPAATITTLTVNPAVCRGPDGTYFMIVKGDKPGEKRFVRNQALATSPAPEGPWTIQPRPVIDYLDTEDVSMWYDATRRSFFAVFHAHRFIGLIRSSDGYTWEKAEPFEWMLRHIALDDGTEWRPERTERPFVLTDDRGSPFMLYVACKKGGMSANLAIPVR